MHAISGRYFQRPITKSAKDKDRIPKKKPENKARCAPHLSIRTFFTTWIDYATWTSRCASLSRSTARGCTACCCLLLHGSRASSPLMWDARTSVCTQVSCNCSKQTRHAPTMRLLQRDVPRLLLVFPRSRQRAWSWQGSIRRISEQECNHVMLRCCCCLLFHGKTRAARASSHLVWYAQTSVWALAPFQTFSVATIELGSSE